MSTDTITIETLRQLVDYLGVQLVADIGLADQATVSHWWLTGNDRPRGTQVLRLRHLDAIAQPLRLGLPELTSAATLHWFYQQNRWVARRAPYEALSQALGEGAFVQAAHQVSEAALRMVELGVSSREQAASQPIHQVVTRICQVLDPRQASACAGCSTDQLERWSHHTKPQPRSEERLRQVYRLILVLLDDNIDTGARIWIAADNQQLDRKSPAKALRNPCFEQNYPRVLAAAFSFVTIPNLFE